MCFVGAVAGGHRLARQRVNWRICDIEVEDTGGCFTEELSSAVAEEFVDDSCDEADGMEVFAVGFAVWGLKVDGCARGVSIRVHSVGDNGVL